MKSFIENDLPVSVILVAFIPETDSGYRRSWRWRGLEVTPPDTVHIVILYNLPATRFENSINRLGSFALFSIGGIIVSLFWLDMANLTKMKYFVNKINIIPRSVYELQWSPNVRITWPCLPVCIKKRFCLGSLCVSQF